MQSPFLWTFLGSIKQYLIMNTAQRVENFKFVGRETVKSHLSPEFFPQQYTSVYIQHMPHSQVLLSYSVHSSGARLGGTSAHGQPL